MPTPTDADALEAFYQLALGGDADKRLAQKTIFDFFAPAVTGYLAKRFPSLDSMALEDCLTKAFLQFFNQSARDDYDPDRGRNLLFTIAHRRAIDALRAQMNGRASVVDYLDDINAVLQDTETGKAWEQAANRGEATEIADLFKEMIPTLPKEQQEVARAMARGFPGQLTDKDLCNSIFGATGKSKTVVSVKRCRQEIRQKFDALLKGHGIRQPSTLGVP